MSDYIIIQEAIDRLSEVLSSEADFEKAKQVIIEAPIVDEKEIIRKAFERVVERLEERKDHIMKEFVLTDKAKEVKSDSLNRINELDGTIEIVKEECGISE